MKKHLLIKIILLFLINILAYFTYYKINHILFIFISIIVFYIFGYIEGNVNISSHYDLVMNNISDMMQTIKNYPDNKILDIFSNKLTDLYLNKDNNQNIQIMIYIIFSTRLKINLTKDKLLNINNLVNSLYEGNPDNLNTIDLKCFAYIHICQKLAYKENPTKEHLKDETLNAVKFCFTIIDNDIAKNQ